MVVVTAHSCLFRRVGIAQRFSNWWAMPTLPLVNRQKLVRQLENDQPDAGAVDLADAVAGPGAVVALLTKQLVAGAREIIRPVFVARLVKRLRCVQVRVVIMP